MTLLISLLINQIFWTSLISILMPLVIKMVINPCILPQLMTIPNWWVWIDKWILWIVYSVYNIPTYVCTRSLCLLRLSCFCPSMQTWKQPITTDFQLYITPRSMVALILSEFYWDTVPTLIVWSGCSEPLFVSSSVSFTHEFFQQCFWCHSSVPGL